MKFNALVSVIIPVYNVEKYLKKCIESITNQTYKNIEIILVNDGSTDNSYRICQEFSEKDTRIVLLNKQNGGLSDATNYGLKFATGDYVVFVDSDDYVKSNYVESLYRMITKYKVDVVACEYSEVSESGKVLKEVHFNEPQNINKLSGKRFLQYLYEDNYVANVVAWNKIYKRSLFNSVRFEKGRYYEDEFLIVPMFWKVKTIVLLRESLYYYVQREGSITQSAMNKKKIMDATASKAKRVNFLVDKNDPELFSLVVQDYKNWLITISSNAYIFKDKKLKRKLQKIYRDLTKKQKAKTTKENIKDILGCIDLSLMGKISSYNRQNKYKRF